ncbi:hypothetical protein FYJ59_03360, partial [Lachnospiraceae bacterium WCA3-601-WT-6H]|nr:hypothetical protein [Waltera intestinalis]
MADAGRILIIPKGNYNAEITYEVLDLVFNNGNSWLCKKTTKGIDPSDSNAEYWYKFTNFDSIIKNNVTTSEEGFALDARQGKVLMEAINGVSARVTSLSESTTASVSDLDAKINEAKNIAKGRNQARVFATTDAMKEWLKNAANKGIANQGDNLYIVTKDVPDYWVAEVLDTPNDEGYYYEVEELETQKVDLTTLNAAVDQLTNEIADVNGNLTYSTEETICGKWIDGSNIYRVVKQVTSNINTNIVAMSL